MPAIAITSGRLHSEFIRLLFLQTHRETDRFFAASGVQLAQTHRASFYFRRAAFLAQLKSRVGLPLAKAEALRINLNIDGSPIVTNTEAHEAAPSEVLASTSAERDTTPAGSVLSGGALFCFFIY